MKITRKFTKAGQDVYEGVEWTTRSSRILNPDGSKVFEMNDAQVPKAWSQLATDIMVSKYFRKAGVPQRDEKGNLLRDENGKTVTGPERSAKQVIHRLAGCWRYWGEKHNYFDTQDDAQAFYDELAHMLLTQMAAPNSPQWFNTGLNFAYGISGPAQGHWVVDPANGEAKLADDAYTHPQPHACFIQSVDDDLVNPGGIMDLWTREARLFKYGSGTGTNFSRLRGDNEPLSGGGKSSGLMSFLKIGDRAAGAIKSGGTTRRAAKMVCLDLDHPDIENFVEWKVREELKVAALVEGLKHLPEAQQRTAAEMGLKLDYDFNGEAYLTVSGQNSNNSVRIPNEFFKSLDADESWDLTRRTDGKTHRSVSARSLWDKIAYAAWRCADPGVQYDTTINQWHTCPVSGRINASNPCSEYMFLDNTACNLASFNLLKFYDAKTKSFDVEAYEHAIKLWTIVLEISVLMAAFPSKEIARLSYEYRTLGLGYANIGAMLMQAGIPYDSEQARALCGALTAILTGRSYATSAELAAEHGPFRGYFKNKEHMLRVIRNHRRAAYGVSRTKTAMDLDADHESGGLGDYEGLEIRPVGIHAHDLDAHAHEHHITNSETLLNRARSAWDDALKLGKQHGFRNAQTTVIAPTGTIGLLMDCDTTGVEPDFALVKFKKLAGGGYFKIANQSLRPALESLGYNEQQVRDILTYVMGTLSLDVNLPNEDGSVSSPGTSETTFAGFLHEKGLTDKDLARITDSLGGAMELSFVFNAYTLGEDAIKRLNVAGKPDVLRALGLTKKQIDKLNTLVCGTGTVEGAPHLKGEHLAVFDCANKCGRTGKRFIAVEGHIRMMAAAQPFISGAISKTINLPNEATIDDIKSSYRLSWELGLKANALYRDGCKLSQVLNSSADASADDEADDEEGIEAGKDEVSSEVATVANHVASAGTSPRKLEAETVGSVERIVERIIERPMRRRLPDTRRSITHKFNVAGHEGYLTVGLYEDGQPGELFITMAKEGSTIGGLMDSLGTAISVALQYGVPIESLVNKFTHQRFEPAGMTHNSDIPFAKSLVDYIFRWMGMEFIAGYRAANAPQRSKPRTTETSKTTVQSEPTVVTTAAAKVDAIVKPTPVKAGNGHDHKHDNGDMDSDGGGDGDDRGGRPLSIVDAPRRLKATGTSSSTKGAKITSLVSGSSIAGDTMTSTASINTALKDMQADAPACDSCGTITVRSGTCYKCLNCGNSMGCS
ncbi:MAG: adenosylcobalamin-dependent ribonucleoside-diphosphate reductase [Phycisphaera sp.]|nr:adenosylcobalamin-dependent ribonucleoside-diphosphate reductase [Phycisphaera sp.]